jgi:hypothetical protein
MRSTSSPDAKIETALDSQGQEFARQGRRGIGFQPFLKPSIDLSAFLRGW